MGEVCCKNDKQNQEEVHREVKTRKEENVYATYNSRESRFENIQMAPKNYNIENNHIGSISNINHVGNSGGGGIVTSNYNDSNSQQGKQDERVHTSPRNNNLTNSLSMNSPSGPSLSKINITNTFIKAASQERLKKWMETHKDYKFEAKLWPTSPYKQKHCIICGYNYVEVMNLIENEDWKAINYWSSLEVLDFYTALPDGGPRDMAIYTCSKTGAKICHGCFARSDLNYSTK